MAFATYQLLIHVSENLRIRIGQLGTFDFPAGSYVYTGSAKRNPEARIARHLAKSKRLRWHIDYLLAASGVEIEEVLRFDAPECEVNRLTSGCMIAARFGASDCRAGCGSHLKYRMIEQIIRRPC
jgi:Uri superfamily endonuclease